MTTSSDRAYQRLAFKILAEFGGIIAIPAVLAALAGKWLDTKYQTAPRYLIILLVLAFVLTAYSIKKKSAYYGRLYESITQEPKDLPRT